MNCDIIKYNTSFELCVCVYILDLHLISFILFIFILILSCSVQLLQPAWLHHQRRQRQVQQPGCDAVPRPGEDPGYPGHPHTRDRGIHSHTPYTHTPWDRGTHAQEVHAYISDCISDCVSCAAMVGEPGSDLPDGSGQQA